MQPGQLCALSKWRDGVTQRPVRWWMSRIITELHRERHIRSIKPHIDLACVTYIYIYAFSRCFYPKRLTLHSSYSFTFDQLLLSLGIEPMILALLAPCSTSWATGKPVLNRYTSSYLLSLNFFILISLLHWPSDTLTSRFHYQHCISK